MFRYTDEPRHPHPSDQLNKLADGMIALAVSSGACALAGFCFYMGWLS